MSDGNERSDCPVFRPDHNGECVNCDEWGDAHTPAALEAGRVDTWREELRKANETVEQLRDDIFEVRGKYALAGDEIDRQRERLAAKREELLKANDKVEAFRAMATDLSAKVQCLVDWADSLGLLEEHLFTFPDGESWEATR